MGTPGVGGEGSLVSCSTDPLTLTRPLPSARLQATGCREEGSPVPPSGLAGGLSRLILLLSHVPSLRTVAHTGAQHTGRGCGPVSPNPVSPEGTSVPFFRSRRGTSLHGGEHVPGDLTWLYKEKILVCYAHTAFSCAHAVEMPPGQSDPHHCMSVLGGPLLLPTRGGAGRWPRRTVLLGIEESGPAHSCFHYSVLSTTDGAGNALTSCFYIASSFLIL